MEISTLLGGHTVIGAVPPEVSVGVWLPGWVFECVICFQKGEEEEEEGAEEEEEAASVVAEGVLQEVEDFEVEGAEDFEVEGVGEAMEEGDIGVEDQTAFGEY